jgi:hypothetical protein
MSSCFSVRGGTKVMPPIFFLENLIAITVKFTWMFHTSVAIMRQFFHEVFIIFNTRLLTLSKTLCTSVIKLSGSTYEHENFVSICCRLQNDVHTVHPLEGQPNRWYSEGATSGL